MNPNINPETVKFLWHWPGHCFLNMTQKAKTEEPKFKLQSYVQQIRQSAILRNNLERQKYLPHMFSKELVSIKYNELSKRKSNLFCLI